MYRLECQGLWEQTWGLFRDLGFFSFTDEVLRYGGLDECPLFLDSMQTFLGY